MPVIDAKGPEGNGFAIIAAVRQYLRTVKRQNEWPDIQKKMLNGDYANLCTIAEEVSGGNIRIVNR